jgi:hypothetical protein
LIGVQKGTPFRSLFYEIGEERERENERKREKERERKRV